MPSLMEFLLYPWYFVLTLLGLGLIIFLHELGHFLMAKRNQVRVEIFSLGFGPAIWRWKRGETEYRISWLPLGGYVKMAGESIMDERRGEPWELTSKSPWQRFQIFSAGAVMNLLIAFPIAIFAYAIGKVERTNEVGVPGMAESLAGMMPGDVVVDVDGRKIESLDKFHIEMVRRQNGTRVPVTVLRKGQEVRLTVETMSSPHHGTQGTSNALQAPLPGSILEQKGVREGDELFEIDGEPVYFGEALQSRLHARAGKTVELAFRRRQADFKDTEIRFKVDLKPMTWHVVPQDDALMEPVVGAVVQGRPAHGKLEPKDRVVRVGTREVRSWQDLREAIEPRVREPVEIEVLRDGEKKLFTLTPSYKEGGVGGIGIGQSSTSVLAFVKPGSHFERAGFRSGDRLWSIDGVSGTGIKVVPDGELPGLYPVREEKPRIVKVQVDRAGEKDKVSLELRTAEIVEADLAAVGFATSKNFLKRVDGRPYRRRPFGEAFKEGLYEPLDIGIMTFEVLKKLVTGGESARGLSGPLGIFHASFKFAELHFGNFVWLLCLITVNLGIFNLLPIPVLDGGHNVLLAIEVVRKWFGKPPPSEKFIISFQYAGLFFILALFLFVTFNDVSRLF